MPVQHGSLVDTINHELSPELGPYKSKKKKTNWI
jgi:hypothetical protein